jgi:hypothetical protein
VSLIGSHGPRLRPSYYCSVFEKCGTCRSVCHRDFEKNLCANHDFPNLRRIRSSQGTLVNFEIQSSAILSCRADASGGPSTTQQVALGSTCSLRTSANAQNVTIRCTRTSQAADSDLCVKTARLALKAAGVSVTARAGPEARRRAESPQMPTSVTARV